MSRSERGFHPLRVIDVRVETPDAVSFDLEVPEDMSERFGYVSGQFCTIAVPVAGVNVMRCYSMSSSPELAESLAFTVKRVPDGALSNWLNDELTVGDLLDVSEPTGGFVLRDGEAPLVCFCAGSGITPVFALIKTVLASTERSIKLLYANRDAGSIIFGRQLATLADKWPGRLEIVHHLDDEAGYVTSAQSGAFADTSVPADVYICGPNPFMDIVESGLGDIGFPPERIIIERFDVPVADRGADVDSNTEKVVVRLGGLTHRFSYRSGDTVLAAARRGGLNPPFSCQAGSCATCMASLREGEVVMKVNDALDEDEVAEGWILTCQAVPLTPEVVVDYDA